ncbi:hypothetical protein SB85_02410 [Xanthomonas sacchari]|nr:hypothetical protein SB85_02410 [Xanthomonas sacchari]
MSSPQWLVPFQGRHQSGATTQNFLWRQGNVYIMDNHRAALWCWLQEAGPEESIGLLHIDEHFDTLYSRIDEWLEHLPELRGLTISQYLALEYFPERSAVPLVRWDNYLSVYLERYAHQVKRSLFATHGVGDKPRVSVAMHVESRTLPGNLLYYLQEAPERWIVNVDLDYFFCNDEAGNRCLMFSPEYIASVFLAIRAHLDAGKVACLTLCLTPDEGYTGGWAPAEAPCQTACQILGVPFSLPP